MGALMAENTYLRLRFALTSGQGDRLLAELWSLGTLGLESISPQGGSGEQVLAYFEEPPPIALSQRLASGVAWPEARIEAVERLAAADWLAEFRRQVEPLAVGRRFLVDAREPEGVQIPEAADRFVVRVPARSAFGTGSHESTQLAIELMEDLSMPGRRVLDVGTGTAILAFAALALGADEVVGVDVDPVAAFLAFQNCSLNRWSPHLVAGTVDCLRAAPRFDLALVNVLPERIHSQIGSIAELLFDGGLAIFSGLLVEQQEGSMRELARFGLVEKHCRRSGEWLACLVEKTG
jgi:ribosomal protein L11 methyltransferase